MAPPPHSAVRAPGDVPPLVTLHLWRVPRHHVPTALARMALDPLLLRRVPGLRFARMLGTGSGRTFTLRDATPRRWGLLASWDTAEAARVFDRDAVTSRRWDAVADERFRADLRPLAARGRWSGHTPFGDPQPVHRSSAAPSRSGATPVAALTRARIATRKAATFWRAVPPVSADLHRVDGLRLAVGIGEAPVGLQGTFSLWDSAGALRDFAYRGAAHAEVVARTATEGWYREELFARFAVLATAGTVDGVEPLT